MELGAGRIRKEDDIDPAVGIVFNKKIANKVETGEVLAYIHANDKTKGEKAVQELKEEYVIEKTIIDKPKHILGIIE